MELGIDNFTEKGNHLKWRNGWENFQKEKCYSKSKYVVANRNHYDRIFNALTDTRSIDILVDESTESVKKMSYTEIVTHYIKTGEPPEKIALKISLMVPEKDYKTIFNDVIKAINISRQLLEQENLAIAVDGKVVEIIANGQGVRASKNPLKLDLPTMVKKDFETGETKQQTFKPDLEAPVDTVPNPLFLQIGGPGERIMIVPSQFSVPTRLPPPIPVTTFNVQALPSTNELYARSTRSKGNVTISSPEPERLMRSRMQPVTPGEYIPGEMEPREPLTIAPTPKSPAENVIEQYGPGQTFRQKTAEKYGLNVTPAPRETNLGP